MGWNPEPSVLETNPLTPTLTSLHHVTSCFGSHVLCGRPSLTNASGAVGAGVVTTATNEHLPLAGEGAHAVQAGEPRTAGLAQTHALINVCRTNTNNEACGDRGGDEPKTGKEKSRRRKGGGEGDQGGKERDKPRIQSFTNGTVLLLL